MNAVSDLLIILFENSEWVGAITFTFNFLIQVQVCVKLY